MLLELVNVLYRQPEALMGGAGSGEEARLAGLKLLWQGQSPDPQALLSAGRTISSPSASAAPGSKVVRIISLVHSSGAG